MHKFTNPLMVVHEKLATTTTFAGEGPANGHHVVLNAVAANNRPIDDYFLLDFAASTTATTTGTPSLSSSLDQNSKTGEALSSVLIVGKKTTTTSSTAAQASTTPTLAKRKNMSMSPVYTIDEGHTMHQLKVSAVPLSLTSNAGRVKNDKKCCDDVQGFDKHDSEDGSTLADFLNLLSPDPGFESACGGDCSPPPVDLSALDGLSLDFPLNGCCNGDTGYGSSSSLGGGSPPSTGSSSSVLHSGVESDNQFRGSKVFGDQAGVKKQLQQQSGVKRKLGFNQNDCELSHFGAKKSFTELSPSPSKRSNPDPSVSGQLDAVSADPIRSDLFQNFGSPDYPADPKTGFPMTSSLGDKCERDKTLPAGKFKILNLFINLNLYIKFIFLKS